jgi:sulfite exporter TauE/SafE
MIALTTAVLTASLLGSLHCAGMCGPFVAFAVGGSDTPHRWRLHVAYHGGRLATYSLLGALAGAAGALIDVTATLVGLQGVAMAAAGGMMVLFGVVTLAQAFGWRVPNFRPPKFLATSIRSANRFAGGQTPLVRALVIGLASTLLPCGWLYAFAVTAAGTSSPAYGAVVMAVFWAGTLPVLATLGVGVQSLLGPLRSRLPVVTAAALVVAGLVTLSGRLSLDVTALAAAAQQQTVAGQVPDANRLPPCCQPKASERTE